MKAVTTPVDSVRSDASELASPRAQPREFVRTCDDASSGTANEPSFYIQASLMLGVIGFGCLDIILRQIVAKTLSRFSYMLSLATAAAFFPMYWCILLVLISIGVVPREQMNWVWAGWKDIVGSFRNGFFSAPYLKLFFIAALGDAVGNGLGYICTPYVAGPVHSLLAQCTIMFTAVFSVVMLRKRYSFAQVIGLVGVEVAVLIGVIPSLGEGKNSSDPFFALILGLSCAFNAIAWVVKEQLFKLYKECPPEVSDYEALVPTDRQVQTQDEEGERTNLTRKDSLHIFVVNSHVALFQLPLSLLLVPLAQATGQTQGKDVMSYLLEGASCFAGDTDQGVLCPESVKFTGYYVICNIVWNWIILLNVKYNGALATFVALKAISPCGAVLFAYVDWPLLHTTPVKPVTWAVFLVLMPFIMFYIWASKQQQKRAEARPPTASCCWPLGSEPSDTAPTPPATFAQPATSYNKTDPAGEARKKQGNLGGA